MQRLKLSFVLSVVLLGTLLTTGAGAQTLPGCAGQADGGEWPSYGLDLHNTRNQTAETTIGPDNVGDLTASWSLVSDPHENFRSTPVVADGCAYLTSYGPGVGIGTSATASVYSVNADTGELVWRVQLPSPPSLIPGLYAPSVMNGVVYAAIAGAGIPYVIALDQATGETLWTTYLYQSMLDGDLLTGINASMVAFDGLLFVPLTGADAIGLSHPSFYLLDAETGNILKKTAVIPQEYWTSNYAGGGIWTTAAVDTENKALYVGTSNPYNKRNEHDRTNAMLKINVDRWSHLFGQVERVYKGDVDFNPDQYHSPECTYLAELILVGFSTFCGQDDVDFGSSPNLFTDSEGRLLVGDLQKSGTYHVADAETMEPVWAARELSDRSAGGNAATAAVDDEKIYVPTNGPILYALDKDDGSIVWEVEYDDAGAHYQPATVANGVVYTLGNNGHIYAFDAEDGSILLNRKIEGAGASCASVAGGGLTVARNTVYIECDVAEGALGAVGIPTILTGSSSAVFALTL